MRHLSGFPQLGVKAPRQFLGTMSRFDPLLPKQSNALKDSPVMRQRS